MYTSLSSRQFGNKVNMHLMNLRKRSQKTVCFLFLLFFLGICPQAMSRADSSEFSVLQKSIIDYNLKAYEQSIADGTYRGEAGIMNIGPEVALSLGIKAFINDDYLNGVNQEKQADLFFSKAVSAMAPEENGSTKEEQTKKIGTFSNNHNFAFKSARDFFLKYKQNLATNPDERWNKATSLGAMEKLMKKSFQETSYNLREGLGRYYNFCKGLPENTPALTPENIRFVNSLFNQFTKKAPKSVRKRFDLDTQSEKIEANWETYRKLGERDARSPYMKLLTPLFEKQKKRHYPTDPLLFMALMRRESNFNPQAVSYVGAAGLTQIMPETGIGLGMKTIYDPDYFDQAMNLLRLDRKARHTAISIIPEINERNMMEKAALARDWMQQSTEYKKKSSALFARYREELLKSGKDDRLDAAKSIAFGYLYFSKMMEKNKGDISLALASYNAGPHRVNQYDGIPPYNETVTFRNKVLSFYREYLQELKAR